MASNGKPDFSIPDDLRELWSRRREAAPDQTTETELPATNSNSVSTNTSTSTSSSTSPKQNDLDLQQLKEDQPPQEAFEAGTHTPTS